MIPGCIWLGSTGQVLTYWVNYFVHLQAVDMFLPCFSLFTPQFYLFQSSACPLNQSHALSEYLLQLYRIFPEVGGPKVTF